jgi:hypothetical protein
MPFGFDPSLIFSTARPEESLTDILNSRSQRQVQQANLTDMLFKQRQQQTLAALIQQNAGQFSDPYASSAARAGVVSAPDLQQQADQLSKIHAEVMDSQRRRAALADTASPLSQFRSGLITQLGGSVPSDLNTGDISDQEMGLLERAQTAKQRAQILGLTRGMGALPDLNQGALDIQVHQAAKTGIPPKFGSGPIGAKQRIAFWNRMAELYPGVDLATNGAAYGANKHDLTKATENAAITDVNEAKALADIEVFQKKMEPLYSSGSQWLNKTVRELQASSGNPEVSAFLTARTALATQVNKVLNQGTGFSEATREEALDMLNKGGSIAQLNAILGVLVQDMARSKDATHKRVDNATARISGKVGEASGVVLIRRKSDGAIKPVKASDAARFLKDSAFEAVK